MVPAFAALLTTAGLCHKWEEYPSKYIVQGHSKCDEPGSGSPYAVDLKDVIGPKCKETSNASGCCYQPVGYDGGPDYGTPCSQVCAATKRVTTDDSYCDRSDGSKCACGFLMWTHRLASR